MQGEIRHLHLLSHQIANRMIQLNINHPLSSLDVLDVLQVLLDAEGSELSNGLHAPEIVATDILPDLLLDLAHVEGSLRLLAHDL